MNKKILLEKMGNVNWRYVMFVAGAIVAMAIMTIVKDNENENENEESVLSTSTE